MVKVRAEWRRTQNIFIRIGSYKFNVWLVTQGFASPLLNPVHDRSKCDGPRMIRKGGYGFCSQSTRLLLELKRGEQPVKGLSQHIQYKPWLWLVTHPWKTTLNGRNSLLLNLLQSVFCLYKGNVLSAIRRSHPLFVWEVTEVESELNRS